tara:strand:+ start:294 stop:641 length:348 start_codon:yes stop_codon:yes gene_type:complete
MVGKVFWKCKRRGEFFEKGEKWEKEDIRIFRRLVVQKGVGRKKTFGYSDARMFRKESGDRIACKTGKFDKSVKILLFVLMDLYVTQRRKFAGANRKVVICYALGLSALWLIEVFS